MKKLKNIFLTLALILLMIPINVLARGSISVSTTNLTITKGSSATFTINADNCAGRVDISTNNSSIASISSTSEFLDMNSVTITVKANSVGSTSIKVYTTDVTSYDDEDLTGKTYTINVNVVGKSTPKPNPSPSTGGTNNNSNTNNNKPSSNTNNKSSNVDLTSLEVEGFNLNKVDKNNYTLTVPYSTDKVNIKAVAEDINAKITGTGTHELKVGENNIEIIVTSQSGTQNKINIKITRKDSYTIEDLDNILKDSNIKEANIKVDANTKLSSNDIDKIKKSGKKINFDYYDNNNKLLYSILLDGSKINNSKELNLNIDIKKPSKEINELSNYADGKQIIINNNLPEGTKIKLYVGDKYNNGDKLNIYYYDKVNNKLVKIEDNLIVKDGYIEFSTTNGNNYLITMSNIKNVESNIKTNIKTNNDKKDNSFNIFVVFTIIELLIIIGLIVFYFIKKKNKNNKNNIDNTPPKELNTQDNIDFQQQNNIENNEMPIEESNEEIIDIIDDSPTPNIDNITTSNNDNINSNMNNE